MKCKKSIALLTVVFILTLVMIATVEARPLRNEVTLEFQGGTTWVPDHGWLTWSGKLEGDIEGTIYIYATGPPKDTGESSHFLETWEIIGEGDNWLNGSDTTLVNWANNKFMTHGVVTEATGDWAHLVGRRFHASGIIDWLTSPFSAPSEIRIN